MRNEPFFQLEFQHAAGLDTGNVRNTNQDAVVCCPENGFFAVIDGMGGLTGGGQTADMLKDILPVLATRLTETLPGECPPELAGEALAKAIAGVSDSIFERTNEFGSVSHGAALCAVWLVERCAVFVHLGDSRGYWLGRDAAAAIRLTEDHNVAAEMVAAGMLKPEEARGHVYSARLTRFVGMRAPSAPRITYKRLNKGDRLLLCSDGLYGELEDAELTAGMRGDLPLQENCNGMIKLAKQHGGRDNISLICISI